MTLISEPATPIPADRRHHMSWSSVIAGTLVAIAVMALLGELCSGMGWSIVRPLVLNDSEALSATSVLMSGIIAAVLCGIISLFLGGWISGHLARRIHPTESVLHGVLVWALSMVLLVAVAAASIGMAIGGSFSLLASAFHGVGEAGASLAKGVAATVGGAAGQAPVYSWDSIKNQAEDIFSGSDTTNNAATPAKRMSSSTDSQSDGPTVASGMHAAYGMVQQMFASPAGTPSESDQRQLESVLVAKGHMTQEQAHQQVQQWVQEASKAKQTYEQAKAQFEEKARRAAAATAKFTAEISFIAFVATLLGLSCAALGGMSEAQRPDSIRMKMRMSRIGSGTQACTRMLALRRPDCCQVRWCAE